MKHIQYAKQKTIILGVQKIQPMPSISIKLTLKGGLVTEVLKELKMGQMCQLKMIRI